jgi:hypothetical protein
MDGQKRPARWTREVHSSGDKVEEAGSIRKERVRAIDDAKPNFFAGGSGGGGGSEKGLNPFLKTKESSHKECWIKQMKSSSFSEHDSSIEPNCPPPDISNTQ